MITSCPHCSKALQLNEAQKEKIAQALTQLKPGTTLKLGCPHCRQPIQIHADGTAMAGSSSDKQQVKAPDGKTQPPDYPDISWLASGIYEDQDIIEDIPQVLIIADDAALRENLQKAYETLGYQVDFAESAEDAIAKMRFVNFSSVVFYTEHLIELSSSAFHAYMQAMPMSKRRDIYYVLIGKDFHTFYNLEALSYSANVVINEAEVEYIDIILRKGLRDYEELFGPLFKALREAGQR